MGQPSPLFLSGGEAGIESGIFLFYVLYVFDLHKINPHVQSLFNFQDLLAIGMQSTCPISVSSWWEETLSWPIALRAICGM